MQPYPNPNYYMQYQQQYNPYLQRMENLQQFQQAINPPVQSQQFIPIGKIVESIDMVKVADIPMDGNTYYFPKADGSEIYSKQFMPNGQTRILTFKPLLDSEPDNLANNEEQVQITAFKSVLDGIQEDLRVLNDKVDKLYKPAKVKKEVSEDE